MRAFVYRLTPSGTDRLGTGRVTPEYTSYQTMQRYWLSRRLRPGTYRVYLYHNWERRYREADRVETLTIAPRLEGDSYGDCPQYAL